MIDGNISMEEDTELRDLVVQTLENNGVLAKVRAELRASVFLTLEEQESVLNSEPLLNKSVKQYLATSEGKLLFSLVREFLEYFGLDYTIAVYDPETYFGKEYNYVGRKKLCEELGINSKEPLLGEILKNIKNGALNSTHKNNTSNNPKMDKTNEVSEANATFDVSVPKIIQNDSVSISDEISEKLDTASNSDLVPMNITITDKKEIDVETTANLDSEIKKSLSTEMSDTKSMKNIQGINKSPSKTSESLKKKEIDLNLNYNTVITSPNLEIHQNQDLPINKKGKVELQVVNNVKNTKQIETNHTGKTVFFDQIIVDGKKEKMSNESELLLGALPPLQSTNNAVFGDLPPLNGNQTNINDLKELMDDIAQGAQYEEDSPSSASGSANEQSPLKQTSIPTRISKIVMDEEKFVQNLQSEDDSEQKDKKISKNKNINDSHLLL